MLLVWVVVVFSWFIEDVQGLWMSSVQVVLAVSQWFGLLAFEKTVNVLRWLFLVFFVSFGMGMHDGLVLWMHVVFIACLL